MIFLLKTQLSWGLRTKEEIKGYVGRQITKEDYKSITGEEYTES
ncbi:XkdX family protein [Companilactobacillus sp. HBUAS59699]